MTEPVFSLITVCFNEAAAIQKTCVSVATQNFPGFEWIVVDGGSTDGTVDILRTYQDHMAYFVSEKDSGIYNAMNKGLAQAKGDYVLFLNGGDALVDPDVLRHVAARLKTEADIVYGDICLQDGTLYKSLQGVSQPTIRFFLRPQSLNHQATFIRRRLFDRYGAYDETYRYAADYEWFLRVLVRGPEVLWQRLDRVVSVFDRGGLSENRALWPKIFREIVRAQRTAPVPARYRWQAWCLLTLRRCLFNGYTLYKKWCPGPKKPVSTEAKA